MTARVLIDAVAFGYGPVGKALTLRPHLEGVECVLLASRSTAELGWRSGFDRIVSCDTDDRRALAAAAAEFSAADVFISVMNPVSVEFAADFGLPTVVVDSLLWMWDEVPPTMAHADCYVAQGFPGVGEAIGRFGVRNPLMTGAIVDTRFRGRRPQRSQLLVNFGGMRSRHITPFGNSSYPEHLGESLNRVLRHHQFDRVLVTGDARTMAALGRDARIPRAEFGSLGHDDFLRELAESALVLTSPGLTTTYEAFAYGIPVGFLPPQNFSQFIILTRLRAAGAAASSFHWTDPYPDMDIDVGCAESVGVEHVLACIDRFADDKAAQQAHDEMVAAAIGGAARAGLDGQRQFLAAHGGADGARQAADAVLAVLGARRGEVRAR